MKVLVLTGCVGFIGMNFLKRFIETDDILQWDKVYSLDKLTYATKYNQKEYFELIKNHNIFHHTVDLSKCEKLPITENNITVLNFASNSHVDNSIDNPYLLYDENTKLVSNLIKCLGLNNIKLFVQISTDEVYSELPLDATPDKWFDIDTPLKPNNPYSASKASQDCFLMSLKHTFGLNLQFIRLANEFGPFQHTEKMLPATVLRVIRKQPIKIYGKGLNKRQWTPVVDAVEVICHVLNIETDFITHIAYSKEPILNNNEVVDIWTKILKEKYNLDSKYEYVVDRKGHDLMYALKTKKWVDEYFTSSLQKRFEEAIDFYYNNFKRGLYHD